MDYTDLYNFDTSRGVIVPALAEVKEGMDEKYRSIFGSDVDLSPETALGRLLEKDVVLARTMLGVTAQNANQFSIESATGECLDSIGQIFNLKRKTGTHTVVPVTLEFSTETVVVPAGVKMMDKNGNLFTLMGEVRAGTGSVVDGVVRYYGNGTARADDYGEIPGDEGTITNLQTSILGWIGVTNGPAISVGNLVETDAAFRERIRECRAIGVGFEESLISSLKRLDGVYSAKIENNDDYYPAMMNGVRVPGHTVYVCVHGDEAADEEVAQTIMKSMTAGVGLMHEAVDGATLVTIGDISYGESARARTTIYFYRPQMLYVRMRIRVNALKYTGSSLEGDVRSSVLAYLSTLGVADSLSATMVASKVMDDYSQIGVFDIKMAAPDEALDASEVKALSYQKITARAEDIEVLEA